jgi:WD40 repeat protein
MFSFFSSHHYICAVLQRLRLWDVVDGCVVGFVELPEQVTSSKFTPDGQLAVGGCYDGRVFFYQLKRGLGYHGYHTQVQCHSSPH